MAEIAGGQGTRARGAAPHGPGHNNGPTIEEGTRWRRHCWTAARAELLPHLPIEVLRLRLTRARELGLDYRTYAAVRAASGHDVVAVLFSSNALRAFAPSAAIPDDRRTRLSGLTACDRIALASAPLSPEALRAAASALLDEVHRAPGALASFPAIRDDLRRALGRRPGDGVVLVGDMALERDWCAAGRLAAYIPSEVFFACAGAVAR